MVQLTPRARVALVVSMAGAGIAGAGAAALAADGQPVPDFAGGAPAAYVPGSLDSSGLRFNVAVRGATTPSGGALVVGDNPSESRGRRGVPSGSGDLSVARLTAQGGPDPAFGADEQFGQDGTFPIAQADGDRPLAVRQLADGAVRVVAVDSDGVATAYDVDAAGTAAQATPIPTPEDCAPAAATIQPSGRVVVVWSCSDAAGYRISSAFGPAGDPLAGSVAVAAEGSEPRDVVVLESGGIFVLEETTTASALRLLGPNGDTAVVYPASGESRIEAIGRSASGGLLAVLSTGSEPRAFFVRSFGPDGSAGGVGVAVAVPDGFAPTPRAIGPRIGGSVVQFVLSSGGIGLVGLDAAGALDPTFGEGGTVRYSAQGDPAVDPGATPTTPTTASTTTTGTTTTGTTTTETTTDTTPAPPPVATDSGPLVAYGDGAIGVPLAAREQILSSRARSGARATSGPLSLPVLGFLKRSGPPPTTTTTTTTTPTTTTTTPTTPTTTPTTTADTTPTGTTTATTPVETGTTPSDPPVLTTPVPSATTTTATTTTPATTTTAASAASLSPPTVPLPVPVLPAAATTTAAATPPRRLRFCESRRSFPIRLGRGVPRRILRQVVSAKANLGTQRLSVVRRGRRFVALVELGERRFGRFTISGTLTLRSGRTLTDVRRYRTCRVNASDRPARTVGGVPVG